MSLRSRGEYPRENHYNEYQMDMTQVYYRKILEESRKITYFSRAVLDIGCFDGSLGEKFIERGFKVYGIEAHSEAYKEAEKKGLIVSNRDIEKGLPYVNSFFSLVLAAEIIEHVYDTDFFLDEIYRVLYSESHVIVTIPNMVCLPNRIKIMLGKYPKFGEYQAGRSGGHVRVYTPEVLIQQIKEHGFEIVSVRGANFPCPMESKKIPDWIKILAIKLGDYFPNLAGQVIILAKRPK